MNTSLSFISQLPLATCARSIGVNTRADLSGVRRSSCVTEDDRTPEQRKTHVWAIVARDRCMSGWGGAKGGTSRCAWACHPDVNTDRVFNWVRSRSDMQRVALVDLSTYRPPSGTAHFHVYVCNPDHVAARY